MRASVRSVFFVVISLTKINSKENLKLFYKCIISPQDPLSKSKTVIKHNQKIVSLHSLEFIAPVNLNDFFFYERVFFGWHLKQMNNSRERRKKKRKISSIVRRLTFDSFKTEIQFLSMEWGCVNNTKCFCSLFWKKEWKNSLMGLYSLHSNHLTNDRTHASITNPCLK